MVVGARLDVDTNVVTKTTLNLAGGCNPSGKSEGKMTT